MTRRASSPLRPSWCTRVSERSSKMPLIEQVMAPACLGLRRTAAANQLLFVRSHWVRMPPGMLFRHLVHKMVKAKKPALSAADLPG